MKRKGGLVFAVLLLLLAFILQQIYSEKDRSNLWNHYGAVAQYNRGSLIFEKELTETEIKEILTKVDRISKQYDVLLFAAFYQDESGKNEANRTYVTGQDKYIRRMLPPGNSVPANFSQGRSFFSTIESTNPKAHKLFTFFPSGEYSIYPMNHVLEREGTAFHELNYYTVERESKIEEVLRLNFKDYPIRFMKLSYYEFDRSSALLKSFLYEFLLAFFTVWMLLFFISSLQAKTLGVLRLLGYRLRDIISILFGPFLREMTLFFLLLPGLLTLLLYRTFNARVLGFAGEFYRYGFLLYLVWGLSLLLYSWIISKLPLVSILKEKNFHRALATASFCFLLLSSLILAPLLEKPMVNSTHLLNYYLQVRKDWKSLQKVVALEFQPSKDRSWVIQGIPLDREENPIYQKHKEVYRLLNQTHHLLKMRKTRFFPTAQTGPDDSANPGDLGYEINEHYFKRCKFYRGEHRIQVQAEKNTLYVFLPEEIFRGRKWKAENFIQKEGVHVKLFPYSTVVFPDLSLEARNPQKASLPIFALEADQQYLLEEEIGQGMYLEKQALPEGLSLLKETGILDSLRLKDGQDLVHEEKTGKLLYLRDQGYLFLPGFSLLLLIFGSYLSFDQKSKRKELAIRKMLGYGFLSAELSLLTEVSMIPLFSLGISFLLWKTWLVSDAILLILIVSVGIFHVFRKYQALNIPESLREGAKND